MVALWALDTGYWGGLWLILLPAWAILCLRWSSYTLRERITNTAAFVPALALTGLAFILSVFLPNPCAFLLPLVPLVLLAGSDAYRRQPLRAATEVLLSCALVAVALSQPSTGWAWPPSYAGTAVLAGLLMAAWAVRDPNQPSARPVPSQARM